MLVLKGAPDYALARTPDGKPTVTQVQGGAGKPVAQLNEAEIREILEQLARQADAEGK
jgi:hypothetical protein